MKNLLIFAILASMLTACAGTRIKEEPKITPPPVANTQPTNTAKEVAPVVTAPAQASKIESNPLTDPNNILSKRSVYFDFDKYDVKAEYQEMLKAHTAYLAAHPEASIKIVGSADERGSREYNLALGQKRASAVERFMNLLGIPHKTMETVSVGKESPKALGHDEAAWAENRRADIIYNGE